MGAYELLPSSFQLCAFLCRRELEDVVAAQEKQCVDGWAALNARAASALAPVKGVQPLAEATQMIESMEDVW